MADVVRDLDVSGSDKGLRLERPGLGKIREQWGSVDVVIFAKLDRLARNVIDFRAVADEAAENGAALVSVAESLVLTAPSGRFVATILAAFAEMEAATIAERMSAGIDGARRLGRWAGGKTPLGFKIAPNPNGPGYVLAPEPDEVATVREAADRILSGEPLYRIARDFNGRAVPTRAGKPWSSTTLRRLLSAAPVGRWAAYASPRWRCSHKPPVERADRLAG